MRRHRGIFFVTLLVSTSSMAGPATTQNGSGSIPSFHPIWDNRVAASDHWIIWKDFKRDPLTGNSSRAGEVSYRVQHFGDAGPPVVLADVSEKSDRLIAATCRADGQVLVMTTGKHNWNVAGKIIQIDAEPLSNPLLFTVAMYPEGVIALGFNGRVMRCPVPLFWIPIKDGKLDLAAKIVLDREGFRFHCIRHLNQIAWMNAAGRDVPRSPGRLAAVLSIFDITTNTIRSIQLDAKEFPEGAELSGFDGTHAFDGAHVIDVATGQLKKIAKIDAIGMQDGVIYGVEKTKDELQLFATPIEKPSDRRTVFTLPQTVFEPDKMPWDVVDVHLLVIIGDESIHAWNGQGWVKVK